VLGLSTFATMLTVLPRCDMTAPQKRGSSNPAMKITCEVIELADGPVPQRSA
jgi:hypothetical protein